MEYLIPFGIIGIGTITMALATILSGKRYIQIVVTIFGTVLIGIGSYQLTTIQDKKAEFEKSKTPIKGIISRKMSFESNFNCIAIGAKSRIMANLKDGEPLFDATDPIYAFREDKEIKITLSIRDKNGQIKTSINANNWLVYSYAVGDYNYDNFGYEVIDKDGTVILQLDLRNDCLYLGCVITNRDGSRLRIGGDFTQMEIKPEGVQFDTPLNRIFKYPHEDFFGVRQ